MAFDDPRQEIMRRLQRMTNQLDGMVHEARQYLPSGKFSEANLSRIANLRTKVGEIIELIQAEADAAKEGGEHPRVSVRR